ncbi:hypothetical protein [Streptomyces sp. NPDC014623]|uniref:hypothetical protein n=1 Tax=Streptomyces sp. NPDC014623 TaxID=3364875 RepID=UPI0036F71281
MAALAARHRKPLIDQATQFLAPVRQKTGRLGLRRRPGLYPATLTARCGAAGTARTNSLS